MLCAAKGVPLFDEMLLGLQLQQEEQQEGGSSSSGGGNAIKDWLAAMEKVLPEAKTVAPPPLLQLKKASSPEPTPLLKRNVAAVKMEKRWEERRAELLGDVLGLERSQKKK